MVVARGWDVAFVLTSVCDVVCDVFCDVGMMMCEECIQWRMREEEETGRVRRGTNIIICCG